MAERYKSIPPGVRGIAALVGEVAAPVKRAAALVGGASRGDALFGTLCKPETIATSFADPSYKSSVGFPRRLTRDLVGGTSAVGGAASVRSALVGEVAAPVKGVAALVGGASRGDFFRLAPPAFSTLQRCS